jgi:hypothetical protein
VVRQLRVNIQTYEARELKVSAFTLALLVLFRGVSSFVNVMGTITVPEV